LSVVNLYPPRILDWTKEQWAIAFLYFPTRAGSVVGMLDVQAKWKATYKFDPGEELALPDAAQADGLFEKFFALMER